MRYLPSFKTNFESLNNFNGLSFNDYCLYGFKNRKIADFTNINYDFMDEMPKLENRFISFMCTSDSIHFGFFSDEPNRVFLLRYPYGSDYQIIADSIKDFFNIFLDKISTMFENMKPNEAFGSIPEWGL